MAVGVGALFETKFLYGIPERNSPFLLKESQNEDPYRLFTADIFINKITNKRGEYGSVPYITGHSKTFDASLLWVNSADTWVDLIPEKS